MCPASAERAQSAGAGPLRRALRRLRFTGDRARARLVLGARYVLDVPSTRLDPLRGERIVTWLDAQGFLDRGDLVHPRPASLRALRRVHADAYLESLREPAALESILGFGDSRELLDSVVAMQRAMTGGTQAAVDRALPAPRRPTINLGGGLHHAATSRGAGFCVFNDIAVAIADQRAKGFAGRVLVVDLDLHDGEGTRSIFASDPSVFTFSMHNRHRGPTEAVASAAIEFGSGVDDRAYIELLDRHLPPVFESFIPQLVIYLAGTDVAAGDRLGDGMLSAAGVVTRDRRVLSLCDRRARSEALPLAIVLGGGYGAEAWRHSARLVAYLLTGRTIEPGTGIDVALHRYRELQSLLDPGELMGEQDWSLTAEDLLGGLAGPPLETRLLGYYSETGLELALEQFGLLDRLRALGFPLLEVELDVSSAAGQTLRVWSDADRREVLVELRARRDRAAVPGFELLRIEWMLLQNPRSTFRPDRPRAPGQRHPGLGIAEDILLFLILACERLALDGIVFVPSHFHLASKGGARAIFLEPRARGEYAAVQDLLPGRSALDRELLIAQGAIQRADGSPYAWSPSPMVVAVSARLSAHVNSEAAETAAREARRQANFRWVAPEGLEGNPNFPDPQP